MRPRTAADSRNYVVAFEVRSAADCPGDFLLPRAAAGADAGIFLPRDDPDWFGRSAYPPRILLLSAGTFWAVPHPSANALPVYCEIGRISSIGSGRMLLKGWLSFRCAGFDCTIPYNTRGHPSVLGFIRQFRSRWLGALREDGTPQVTLGDELDIRFANALADELDPGEAVAARFFQLPRESKLSWPLRGTRWTRGDLLAKTDRRLIWITDRDRGSRLQYGTISSCAPLRSSWKLTLISRRNEWHLQVVLPGEEPWRIPITAAHSLQAERFAALAEGRLVNSIQRT